MKIANKIVLLLLAVCMLIVPMASCSDNGGKDKVTNNPSANDGASNAEDGNNENDVPAHATYGGQTVSIFTWADNIDYVMDEEHAESSTILQTVWERNLTVEEQLDIVIEYLPTPGTYDQMGNFLTTLEASISSGDGTFDLVSQYNLTASLAAMRGLYRDIAQNPEVNIKDSEWWPAEILDTIAYKNKLYFISGDIAPTILWNVYCFNYNKEMIRDLQLEDPYTLHKNNQWTWEKFFEMCKDVYTDYGDSGVDEYDRYGLIISDRNMYDAWYHSLDLRLVEKNADGEFVLSEDFGSEKTATWIARFEEFITSEDVLEPISYNAGFYDGNALFQTGRMGFAFDNFKAGVAPPPKADAEQDRYYTAICMTWSLFAIPYDVTSTEVSGAVLEYMGRESYEQVTPMLFEIIFKTRQSNAPEDAEMFDLIRESIDWDFGRLYGRSLGSFSVFRDALYQKKASQWASTAENQGSAISTNITTVLGTLADLKY